MNKISLLRRLTNRRQLILSGLALAVLAIGLIAWG